MNDYDFPLRFLKINKEEFEILNYSQQVEYLKKCLDKANNAEKYFIKTEIRWRSNIEAGKVYDYDRIKEFLDAMSKKEEKLNYLRLIKKNIKQQLDAMKQNDLFEIFVYNNGGASFELKSNNSELNDYLNHIWEIWLLNHKNFITREDILDDLSERTKRLKVLKKELEHEINFFKKLKLKSKQTEKSSELLGKNNVENGINDQTENISNLICDDYISKFFDDSEIDFDENSTNINKAKIIQSWIKEKYDKSYSVSTIRPRLSYRQN